MNKAQEEIGKIIEAETKGGYLQGWQEYNTSLTQEQQRDYFNILGGLILSKLKKLGYRKDKPMKRSKMG